MSCEYKSYELRPKTIETIEHTTDPTTAQLPSTSVNFEMTDQRLESTADSTQWTLNVQSSKTVKAIDFKFYRYVPNDNADMTP